MSSGNLQKIRDGKRTYGITPHIPGGFITADTMQKIVDVTKKYNGVLKITSGQRILITNLKEEDLANIWNDLGMDPAVKTQNSVKNVEMCPAGYCKRSKHNTIGIGMRLSKKYQWMEMPCRTKIGVGGCRNACGSVYSKDVGVIADKTGFVVSVGGSGGYNPRMADIIVEGITEEQALNLVDNIFTYYKNEAEAGEKLGFFIDRIGIDKFKKEVLKDIL
ncbi:nitrite reductase [Clostridium saccharobutylicum]|uniref:NAD(P)/FAD-dependent oxidoreductase n=1 Tax=Clostridium saccharobutylicum TaxID=169679 RepID=UPI000983962B|nr:NAD(P)/FAD-dependent oxidoreductase [Clostridium saccharobutylicum]AQS10210.1 nitrite reductase [Clostridium saccharobutylicum]MBC2436478.1 NAD(P)/FAD-dependent oxidoreductase [Clostridium saccharobutylicum]NSB87607.1 NAD(P)H-nitrite reductase large subunit [Clostridium saccharobutylicum]NYC31140.1 NAD(P)H-nitrite reductase large subunit [Clostridium saccharobutylicum]OOM17713.1 nitrite reductase [Clostridium saccharobutylicum]